MSTSSVGSFSQIKSDQPNPTQRFADINPSLTLKSVEYMHSLGISTKTQCTNGVVCREHQNDLKEQSFYKSLEETKAVSTNKQGEQEHDNKIILA